MASTIAEAHRPAWTTRERPWLVPWNRKLRHLQSISVRNLALKSNSQSKSSAHAANDDALPNALVSPTKLLALHESEALGHSKSSEDLRPIHEGSDGERDGTTFSHNGSTGSEPITKRLRPGGGKLRRRSTLDWSSATPQARQKKMESVTAARLADIFFSLHVRGVHEPIYVSEVVERTMNATFRDVAKSGSGLMRMDAFILKLWVKTADEDRYRLHLELSLCLRALQFIGKDLALFNHPFPQNCIIFQLSDGYYTCFTDAKTDEPADPFLNAAPKVAQSRAQNSASFDTLLRLAKLDDSVQDALSSRDKLAHELSTMLASRNDSQAKNNHLEQTTDYLKTISYARNTVDKQLSNLRRSIETRRATITRRRNLLSTARHDLDRLPTLRTDHDAFTTNTTTALHNLKTSITAQRRRIATDLSQIYPIQPLTSDSLSFTLRGLHLPDSDALDLTSATLPAALGFATHLLQLLSFYLSRPLPYTPHPRSSTSTISDPLSLLSTSASGPSNPHDRIFPLYPRAPGPKYRFEYALFLLNKDIQLLLSTAFGVRVLDIRQSLPNLLLAVTCMAAGEGDLPARKARGVAGLLKGITRRRGGGKDYADEDGVDEAGQDGAHDDDDDDDDALRAAHGGGMNGAAAAALEGQARLSFKRFKTRGTG